MATTTLLGYHAPSFTYGTDLILPVETNIKLRGILLSAAVAEGKLDGNVEDKAKGEVEFEVIREYMSAMNTTYSTQGKRFIPEVSGRYDFFFFFALLFLLFFACFYVLCLFWFWFLILVSCFWFFV